MMRNKNHLRCIAVLAVFFLLAAGSGKINKIHCGAFNYNDFREQKDKGGGYVLLKDGRKVFGDEISWKTGLLVKDMIKVGDEKFKIRDTRGYFINGNYYGSLGSSYAKRIITGKLNVYYTEDWTTVTSTNSRTGQVTSRQRLVCVHYVQVGDEGDLLPIAGQKDILKYVADCPKAVGMIDLKNSQIRKALRKNGNYLNDIFHIYNNGCR